MIVVTGATGQLGSAVVQGLLTRLPATELAVSVRDPHQADHLAERGIRVRHGDFTEPETLPAAFEGATSVLIVSGPAEAAPHDAAVDAAIAAGATHVLYTSHMAASLQSAFQPARTHAATEAHLADAGVRFTILRDGFHATSGAWLVGPGVATGEIRLPADGPVAWTAPADLAAAAVVALTEPDRLAGVTPPLTGREALTFADIALIAADLTGRPVTRTVVDDEEWIAEQVAAGAPEPMARFFLGMFAASRAGEFATVDPTLGDLLGRPTVPFRDVLARTLRA